MIILYEKDERDFNTLGLGVLKDAIDCIVVEELNGKFELEMTYPITGSHYKDISSQRIILAEPNLYDRPQPFRIYSITKPINGRIIVNAEHISYDMSGYIVKAFEGSDLADVLTKIQNGGFPNSPFILTTDKIVPTSMKTYKPYSQRALLAGQSGSLLDIYGGEYVFDRFNVYLLNRRGMDRGMSIRYGKNLTDLENEQSSERMYTGVFPFYSATINETKSVEEKYYQATYIVDGTVPFAGNWLSFKDGGKALIPLMEETPVQIKTEGSHYGKVIYFKYAVEGVNLLDCYIRETEDFGTSAWLSFTEGGDAFVPERKILYKIITEGEMFNKNFIWDEDNNVYVEFSGEGFYYSYEEESMPIPEFPLSRINVTTEEREVYIDLGEDVTLNNGIIPIEGCSESSPQKILSLDLTSEFDNVPTTEDLKNKALEYVAKSQLQKIKETISVSFVKMGDIEEYSNLKDLEVVKLGDYVSVIYDKLEVDSKLQVVSTEFNVLNKKYNEIELGTKSATITDTVITAGDGVSSLTNDKGYADKVSVVNLMVENMTADYIQAQNANLSEAQIKQLETERIEITGMLEASSAHIDSLVAQLLTAKNANIKEKLSAGEIEVKGRIFALSGDIGGCEIKDGKLLISTSVKIGKNEDDTYNFTVDENGNVLAKSFSLSGNGLIPIEDDDGNPQEVPVSTTISNGVLTTSSIVFNNNTVLISKEDDSFSRQSVFFNINPSDAWRIDREDDPSFVNNGVRIKVTLVFTDKFGNIISEGQTFKPYLLSVNVGSRYTWGGDYVYKNHEIIIPSGSSGELYFDVWDGFYFNRSFIYVYAHTPKVMPESQGGETGGLTLNSDFIPRHNSIYSLGSEEYRWMALHLASGVIETSDKKEKKEINYDVSIYEKLFDKLKPSSFKFAKGSSNRTHLGFISQDVENALLECGIDPVDFAGFTKTLNKNAKNKSIEELKDEDYIYGLRYSELHAMAIHEIQSLKNRVKELEQKLNKED